MKPLLFISIVAFFVAFSIVYAYTPPPPDVALRIEPQNISLPTIAAGMTILITEVAHVVNEGSSNAVIHQAQAGCATWWIDGVMVVENGTSLSITPIDIKVGQQLSIDVQYNGSNGSCSSEFVIWYA